MNEDYKKTLEEHEANQSARSSFRWGIWSLITWIIPFFGVPVSIIAIVKASKGQKSYEFNSKADLGSTFGWIGLCLSIINAILGLLIAL